MSQLWAAALALGALAYGGAWAQRAPGDIAGIWQIVDYRETIQPMGGGEIPFAEAGREAYEANIAGLQDGTVNDFAVTLCVPPGVTRIMGMPDPFEFVVTPEVVAILLMGFRRVVRVDEEHYTEEIELFPAFMGDQVGHWDGDTLVIDTLGTNTYTWLDASGVPHGYDLHTVERIRKLEDGRLENVITIEDEEFFTQPWRVRYVYEPHPYVSMATGLLPCDTHIGVKREE